MLGDHLYADHARLEALFEDLLNRVHTSDTETIDPGWAVFERGLLDHLAYEEEALLDDFQVFDPAEAAWVRADHARIRALVAEMGVDVQLHTLREERVERFIESLRAHAAREERLFYRWVSEARPEPPRGWRPVPRERPPELRA